MGEYVEILGHGTWVETSGNRQANSDTVLLLHGGFSNSDAMRVRPCSRLFVPRYRLPLVVGRHTAGSSPASPAARAARVRIEPRSTRSAMLGRSNARGGFTIPATQ